MTSPSVDLDGIMPYGVTVEGTGNRNAEIVTESKFRNSNVALTLPDGPCRVAASWDGSESVRLVHSGHGYPVVLPAGGAIDPGRPRSEPQREKPFSYRMCHPRPSERAGAEQSKCTHSRSSNRRGGGLSDHSSKRPGNYYLLDRLQRLFGVIPGFRELSTAVYRRAIHHRFGAWRNRLGTSINHGGVQVAVSNREDGRRSNRCSSERRPARRNIPIPVVFLRHRWGGLLRNNPQVLATLPAGGLVNDHPQHGSVSAENLCLQARIGGVFYAGPDGSRRRRRYPIRVPAKRPITGHSNRHRHGISESGIDPEPRRQRNIAIAGGEYRGADAPAMDGANLESRHQLCGWWRVPAYLRGTRHDTGDEQRLGIGAGREFPARNLATAGVVA